ncbi:hypothetical protein UFOVP36_44 [uncultured Caudovirales phage]|uniref:Uncharacterized protein n=1 Tax=uncultured Caudovirales phage TaxID=2100421 RepID=A0A6J5KNH7_9CAUD|nr:hypothetical protein UFOVP36_44 [uncultured Caudovirales phage]
MTEGELKALQQEVMDAHAWISILLREHFLAQCELDRADERLTLARMKFSQLRLRYVEAKLHADNKKDGEDD